MPPTSCTMPSKHCIIKLEHHPWCRAQTPKDDGLFSGAIASVLPPDRDTASAVTPPPSLPQGKERTRSEMLRTLCRRQVGVVRMIPISPDVRHVAISRNFQHMRKAKPSPSVCCLQPAQLSYSLRIHTQVASLRSKTRRDIQERILPFSALNRLSTGNSSTNLSVRAS